MWDRFAQRLFITRLAAAEDRIRTLNQTEREFVQSMREAYNERETMSQLGVRPWEPTAKQLNWLLAIAEGNH